MKYAIEQERLVITCTPDEQVDLELMRDEVGEDRFGTDDFTYDLLERLVTDDSFTWIDSRVTGDLTDAPMLALLGDEEIGEHEDCNGLYPCGYWDGPRVQPVLYRWAFMDYCVTTPQEQLLKYGRAVFTGGRFVEREGQMQLCYSEREFGVRNFI